MWVVVEHNGFGPGHRFRVVATYDTREEAYARLSRSNANSRKCLKRYRPLHVQPFREDGRYDLFESDNENE